MGAGLTPAANSGPGRTAAGVSDCRPGRDAVLEHRFHDVFARPFDPAADSARARHHSTASAFASGLNSSGVLELIDASPCPLDPGVRLRDLGLSLALDVDHALPSSLICAWSFATGHTWVDEAICVSGTV